jgi:hypothetical protein
VARQTAIPFAATRRSRSPAGARLAALSRIAFALIAMAFCPKKIAILSLAENGTNQFASANRPGRVFGTAKLEQIRKGAKGGGFGGATPNSISRHQTTARSWYLRQQIREARGRGYDRGRAPR